MCGRYYIDIAKDELSYVNNFSEIEYEQNFNVAPQAQAPCIIDNNLVCLLYTSPSPRDVEESRMPSSA